MYLNDLWVQCDIIFYHLSVANSTVSSENRIPQLQVFSQFIVALINTSSFDLFSDNVPISVIPVYRVGGNAGNLQSLMYNFPSSGATTRKPHYFYT